MNFNGASTVVIFYSLVLFLVPTEFVRAGSRIGISTGAINVTYSQHNHGYRNKHNYYGHKKHHNYGYGRGYKQQYKYGKSHYYQRNYYRQSYRPYSYRSYGKSYGSSRRNNYRQGKPCHPVSKYVYDDYGDKHKIIGQMCYDNYGDGYVVEGSRYQAW